MVRELYYAIFFPFFLLSKEEINFTVNLFTTQKTLCNDKKTQKRMINSLLFNTNVNNCSSLVCGHIMKGPVINLQVNHCAVCVNRGDPTLVKINVAITTGYLISGETNGS